MLLYGMFDRFSILKGLFLREWVLVRRSPSVLLMPLTFVHLVVFLFSFIPDLNWVQTLPYIALMAFAWAHWMSLDALFVADFKQQVVAIWQSQNLDIKLFVQIKILFHYLCIGLSLTLGLSLCLLLNGLDERIVLGFVMALLPGAWILSSVGSVMAILILGLEQKIWWLSLLLLPFYLPCLLVIAGTIESVVQGFSGLEPILGLWGAALLSGLFLPRLACHLFQLNQGL